MSCDAYVRTDTAEDAISSLELAAEFFAHAKSDARYWKWFVIAIHAGLQGTFSLALANGNSLLVQKPGVTERMLAARETGNVHPEPHMDNFQKLYKKIQLSENLSSPSDIPFIPEGRHDDGILSIDELRDDFIHFNAKSWSIEILHIIKTTRSCIEVAEHLLKNSSILWHESSHQARATASLKELHSLLITD